MMKKSIFLFIMFVSINASFFAQTLVAGDIAFIGYNTDSGPGGSMDHSFTFIALTDIPGSEVVYFTEEGWNDDSDVWAGTSEGHLRWTAPASGLSCGTIVSITESGTDVFTIIGGGTINLASGSGWNLSGGDQVLAYQAATAEPATVPDFIAGINGDDGNGSPVSFDPVTSWNDPATGPLGVAKSGLPIGLTNGVDCVSLFVAVFTEQDNAKYIGTLTGTSTDLRGFINDRINWSFSNTTAFDITPSAFSPFVTCVATCNDPEVPTVTFSPAAICNGESATLNISGSLNDATSWNVYTGSCGGTAVGSTTGSTISVTPGSPSTTYFVRGEGGCVTPGSCGTVTVNVNALDDASFNYSASSYCASGVDPTPTITGLPGGTFSSSAGLSINASTGVIDVSASSPGVYTVTYTTVGLCPNSSNAGVTINADTDGDGLCDNVDTDDDNDGVIDIMDTNPTNPNQCADADGDSCDDCAVGTDGFGPLPDNLPNNDGADTDGDGICDAGDADDDNDGVADGSDPAPTNPNICGDANMDGCDDCLVGTDDFGPLPDNIGDATPPTAVCQNINVYLDVMGAATIVASDIDGGSTDNCGAVNLSASQTSFSCADLAPNVNNDLIITGVFDGPNTGGTPKGVELYILNDIADLSIYGIGSANNGGGTDGEEFTFPSDA
ncbi:MAG: immunoglobulin domain-containing protein, partial [Crocinitomicaceae bacterium]